METLIVIGASLTLAFLAGCLAAFGRDWLRILILSGVTVLLLDMTLFPSRLLDHVTSPRRRPPVADLR